MLATLLLSVLADGPYFATGIKVVEPSPTSVVVWTRLTAEPSRNETGPAFERDSDAVPAGRTLAEMRESAAGSPGEVRLTYGNRAGHSGETAWTAVDPDADFTRVFRLEGLVPGSDYVCTAAARPAGGSDQSTAFTFQFRTPPRPDADAGVRFVVIGCQDYGRRDTPDGHRVYESMLDLQPIDPFRDDQRPDFFVHTGDVVYYDQGPVLAKTPELARYKWAATYSLPHERRFHANVAGFFQRDDHDTTRDDAWPGKDYGRLGWDEGLDLFAEQTAVPDPPYRTLRWGRHLQVWITEGRRYRSANTMPDGPDKTIWGAEQKRWLKDSMTASDATWRVLVNATPVVGPDRKNKKDNHANAAFAHEGHEVRAFLASLERDGVPNAVVINGDRHWQYVSVDGETGLREFSVGATSDKRAGGWKDSDVRPQHRYLAVRGGFLSGTVDAAEGTLTLRHHDTRGAVLNAVALPGPVPDRAGGPR